MRKHVALLLTALAVACGGEEPSSGASATQTDSGATAGSPSPRVGPAMAFDSARNVIVMFGGNSGTFLSDTWERRGSAWTKRTPAASPPARVGAAMAYDSARHVTVLFGGQVAGGGTGEATFLNDTWEWDGNNWTQRTPAVSPGARYFAAVAFDADRKSVVMFGGSDRGRTEFGETWEWDGNNWTKYSAAVSPSARADAPMVCDSARRVCLIFSGDRGEFPSDTWERRGSDWARATPASSPPGRGGSAMAFDSRRGVAVLFGGHDGPPPAAWRADTWEWDGQTWSQRTGQVAPPARIASAIAYDAARGVTVLFGGAGISGPLGDTWEWDGKAWAQR